MPERQADGHRPAQRRKGGRKGLLRANSAVHRADGRPPAQVRCKFEISAKIVLKRSRETINSYFNSYEDF